MHNRSETGYESTSTDSVFVHKQSKVFHEILRLSKLSLDKITTLVLLDLSEGNCLTVFFFFNIFWRFSTI